jgi:hypothetical protein
MVAARFSPRDAYVTHHATDSPPWRQHPFAFPPTLVELAEKLFVVFECAELRLMRLVLLEDPVGRRCDDKMYAFVGNPGKVSSIAQMQLMRCGREFNGPVMRTIIRIDRLQFRNHPALVVGHLREQRNPTFVLRCSREVGSRVQR